MLIIFHLEVKFKQRHFSKHRSKNRFFSPFDVLKTISFESVHKDALQVREADSSCTKEADSSRTRNAGSSYNKEADSSSLVGKCNLLVGFIHNCHIMYISYGDFSDRTLGCYEHFMPYTLHHCWPVVWVFNISSIFTLWPQSNKATKLSNGLSLQFSHNLLLHFIMKPCHSLRLHKMHPSYTFNAS